jgi:REP element-mobilizing transposase RayT
MSARCGALEVEILAYGLRPDHVHQIAVPRSADGLSRAIGEVRNDRNRLVVVLRSGYDEIRKRRSNRTTSVGGRQ